jgi:hypothetical protein
VAESEKSKLFWALADPMLASGEVEKGTMMGFPCLRVAGKFFASIERKTDDLIVKLPKERVTELITSGEASPFAPNGRTFKEWALINIVDKAKWQGYLDEALIFVDGA